MCLDLIVIQRPVSRELGNSSAGRVENELIARRRDQAAAAVLRMALLAALMIRVPPTQMLSSLIVSSSAWGRRITGQKGEQLIGVRG